MTPVTNRSGKRQKSQITSQPVVTFMTGAFTGALVILSALFSNLKTEKDFASLLPYSQTSA